MPSVSKKSKSGDTLKAICLGVSNTIEEFKISKQIDVDKIDLNLFPGSVLKSIGKGVISRECDYNYEDKILSLYAWSDGRAGSENKHDLPPPIDKELYYGNIFVIFHQNGKILNLTKALYNEFYETAFGGFEDLGSQDTWSSPEEIDSDDSINDFIVNDDESFSDNSPGSSENDFSLTSGTDTTVTEISLSSDSEQQDSKTKKKTKKKNKNDKKDKKDKDN